jgi:chaperone required for assembly of F1-ATPase
MDRYEDTCIDMFTFDSKCLLTKIVQYVNLLHLSFIYRNTQELKQTVDTLDMLTEKVNHWHAIREECPKVKARFEPLEEKYRTLQKFEVNFSSCCGLS